LWGKSTNAEMGPISWRHLLTKILKVVVTNGVTSRCAGTYLLAELRNDPPSARVVLSAT
jgi:hypothetical protein